MTMTSDIFSSPLFWSLDPLKGEDRRWLSELAMYGAAES